MANNNDVRITVKVFNQEFNKAMDEMQGESKKLNREFKLQEAQMKNTASETEKLSAKLQFLNNKQELASRKVEETARQYEAVKQQFGENSQAAQDMARRLDNARIAEQNLVNEIHDTNQALSEQQNTFKQTGERLQEIGGKMQNAGQEVATTFGAATAVVGGGLALAAKKAMDFESQMSSVKSVMSPDEVQKFSGSLEKLAIKMGADTKYSAQEAAVGIEELLKAGVSTTDILNGGLAGALSLATAGGIDLGSAAEIASTALNAFKDDGISVSKAADILAGAANASATDVEELRAGLQMVSAVASGVGLSFNDTSTALAVFAQNGLKGSDSGTSLKTMLMNLSPSTKEAATEMEKLGFMAADGTNAFYNADGSIKSLAEISGTLKDKLSGLNDEQRMVALRTMFGSDAIRAANILYKEGADGVNNMAKAMGKVSAADVAAEKMNNLKGQVEQLKGALETGAISLGDSLLPVIEKAVGVVQKLVDKFNGLSPGMQSFIAISALVTAAILGVVTSFGVILAIIGSAISAFGAIMGVLAPVTAAIAEAGGVIALLTNPITLVIAAVVALIAIFVALWQNNETFRNKVLEIWASIQAAFQVALAFIMNIVHSVMTDVMAFFGDVLRKIQSFWSENGAQIMSIVTATFSEIWNYIQMVMGIIKGIFEVVWPIISGVVQVAWGLIKTSIKNAIDLVLGIISVALKLLKGDWSGAWEEIKKTAENIMNNILGFFKGIDLVQIGKDIINGLIKGISSMGDAVKKAAKKLAESLPEWVKEFLGIASPSKVMMELGEYTGEGLLVGVEKKIADAKKMAARLAKAITPTSTSINGQIATAATLDVAFGKGQIEAIQNAFSSAVNRNPQIQGNVYIDGRAAGQVLAPHVKAENDFSIGRFRG